MQCYKNPKVLLATWLPVTYPLWLATDTTIHSAIEIIQLDGISHIQIQFAVINLLYKYRPVQTKILFNLDVFEFGLFLYLRWVQRHRHRHHHHCTDWIASWHHLHRHVYSQSSAGNIMMMIILESPSYCCFPNIAAAPAVNNLELWSYKTRGHLLHWKTWQQASQPANQRKSEGKRIEEQSAQKEWNTCQSILNIDDVLLL